MYGEIHGEKHMPKNLNNFISNIETQGVARQNKYRVEISGPASTRPIHGERDLDLRCESITFPGTNVRSVPDTLRYGPAREHAQGMTYGPFSATFICSPDLREKVYFEWWQKKIINHYTWEAKYYDDYRGELWIFQLDDQNKDTYRIAVAEAYPKTISPQDLSASSNDAYQTVAVEFTYRYWREGGTSPEDAASMGDPLRDKASYMSREEKTWKKEEARKKIDSGTSGAPAYPGFNEGGGEVVYTSESESHTGQVSGATSEQAEYFRKSGGVVTN